MMDLDELERITKAGDRYGHVTPERVLDLIAEVRRLRAALSTPIAMKMKWSPWSENMVDGFSQPLGEDVINRETARAKAVTVYYGEKRVYTSMAAFCDAHPKEKS